MVYADYSFYKNSFLGSAISETDFPRLALRASQFLDYYTLGKSRNNPGLEELKMACCAVAEKYQIVEKAQKIAEDSLADAGDLKSESVGSYSVSYQTASEKAQGAKQALTDAQDAVTATARQYLVGTGLLYRGRC